MLRGTAASLAAAPRFERTLGVPAYTREAPAAIPTGEQDSQKPPKPRRRRRPRLDGQAHLVRRHDQQSGLTDRTPDLFAVRDMLRHRFRKIEREAQDVMERCSVMCRPTFSMSSMCANTSCAGAWISTVSLTVFMRSLDDELPPEHPHLAGELELAAFLGEELDGHGLAFGKPGAFPERGEEHHLRA